jgi:hypothetical protein
MKHVILGKMEEYMWREDEEEEVNSYWMASRKGEGTGNWKKKH